MKKFNHLSLLQEAINGNHKGILRNLLEPKHITLGLKFPRYHYLRGQVLVDDVNDLIDEHIPTFTFEKLVQLLFEDVLHLAKEKSTLDLAKAFRVFLLKKEEREAITIKDLHKINEYQFEFRNYKKRKDETFVIHHVSFQRKQLLRGELLIHDMMKALPELSISLPEVIQLRFIDCMDQVEKNNPTIIRNIIAAFERI